MVFSTQRERVLTTRKGGWHMLLNDRKAKILEAIVMDYIATAEPIGSRTIAKKYNWGISSATIRNEMSDLEELGLIIQPHASSGRVPSDSGYRLYVDRMMRHRALTEEETIFLQRMIMANIHHAEYLMQETAKAIAALTRYATIVSEPREKKATIKHVQLMPMDERSILVVCVTDAKAVKNKTLFVQDPPDYDTLSRLSKVLNTHLQNQEVESIGEHIMAELLLAFEKNEHLLMNVLGVITEAAKSEDKVYTSGVTNFLAFPEFADRNTLEKVFQALEERDMLVTLFEGEPTEGIQIIIGAENHVEPLKNCSIIRANYSMGNRSAGSIGIIGPTRMDYAQAVSVMNGILLNINKVIDALTER